MKRLKLNKHYLTIGLYGFGVAVVSLLFGLIVFRLGDILGLVGNALSAIRAIPYGIFLSLVLYPFVNMATRVYSRLFERKKAHPRLVSALSLLSVYLGAFLILGIILLGVIPPLVDSVGELSSSLSGSFSGIESALRDLFESSELLRNAADAVIAFVSDSFSRLVSADLAGMATSLLTGAVGEAFDILLGLVISIYLLAGRRMLGCICGKMVAAFLPSSGAHRFSLFIKRLYSNFTEFMASRLLSALFLGAASYLFFRIFSVPFYALLALVIAVLNLFPVFGTLLSFFFCALVLLITAPAYTLPVLGILAALQLLDNLLIEPRTMPHKALRPNVGATIVLMLLGYGLLGIFGMLIAIPVWATIENALRAFSIHLLNRRGLPTALSEYESFDVSGRGGKAAPAAEGARAEEKKEDAAPAGETGDGPTA
ncbi:MAG: AI-2E family transporter [Clostridia bacterium]|nr:AI-2E family transporter [Clostridia bacterium]